MVASNLAAIGGFPMGALVPTLFRQTLKNLKQVTYNINLHIFDSSVKDTLAYAHR